MKQRVISNEFLLEKDLVKSIGRSLNKKDEIKGKNVMCIKGFI